MSQLRVLSHKMNSWNVKIITQEPEMFPGPLGHSLVGKALDKGIWSLETFNLRDFHLIKEAQ